MAPLDGTHNQLGHALDDVQHVRRGARVLQDGILERRLQFQGSCAVEHDGTFLLQQLTVLGGETKTLGEQVTRNGHHLGGGVGALLADTVEQLQGNRYTNLVLCKCHKNPHF